MKNVMQVERTPRLRPRRPLIKVRLVPQVLDELSACVKGFGGPEGEAAGLLFGSVDEGLARIEVLIRLPIDNSVERGLSSGERLGRRFDEFMSKSKLRNELASLELIGWWCVRAIDDIHLLKKEANFHNQRFRRISDIFLVVRSDESESASASLFARCGDRPLSVEDHRFATLGFSPGIPATEARSVMLLSSWVNSEAYSDVYRVLKTLDVPEKGPRLPEIASGRVSQWIRRIRLPSNAGLHLPKELMSKGASLFAKLQGRLSISRSTLVNIASRPTISGTKSKALVLVSLVLLSVVSGVSLALVHFRGTSSRLPAVVPVRSPKTGLRMRLEVQGEGIWSAGIAIPKQCGPPEAVSFRLTMALKDTRQNWNGTSLRTAHCFISRRREI